MKRRKTRRVRRNRGLKRNAPRLNMYTKGEKYIGTFEIQKPNGDYDVWEIVKRGRVFVIGTATNSGLLSDYYFKMEQGESEQKALEEIHADLEVLADDGPSYMSRVKKIPGRSMEASKQRAEKRRNLQGNRRRGLRRNAGKHLSIRKIKTIDIYGKLWRDKVNGNTYFASRAVVNFGMPDEQESFYPLQYGYGNSYADVPLDDIMARAGIEQRMRSAWRLRDIYGIILRQGSEYAKKSEAKAFGEGR